MSDRELYMWEPTLSPHKLPLFHALRDSKHFARVTYISQDGLSKERANLGWSTAVRADDEIIVGPTPSQVETIVQASSAESVHVFSGLRRVPCIVAGLSSAIKHNRHFGIMSEPRAFEGFAGYARLAQSILSEREIRRHAGFVLAIGAHGPDWFRMTGFPKARVFPYAYFIDEPNNGPETVERGAPVIVGYLGRLERQKGVHLLLEAAVKLQGDVQLKIAGTGTLSQAVSQFSEANSARVQYLGAIPMRDVASFLNDVDILILPSTTKDDGWGVVVSEALTQGAAVIVSELAGASACVSKSRHLGSVVRANSSRQILEAIELLISSGELATERRQQRAEWANKYLTAQNGACYMIKVVESRFGVGASPEHLFPPFS